MTRFIHGCSPGNGHAGTKEYSIWSTMRQRCNNPKNRKYPEYGARGVTICARWDDFLTFLADMGPRPDGYSLDRIDNDGPYSPDNCRWATVPQQNANQRVRRDARWIEHDGRRQTLSNWSRETGILAITIAARIDRYGWPVSQALTQKPDATGA